ncbi:MAG: hypothetical protein ACXAB7_14330 [Candidatus Kariarchaeaceae archaeon]
MKSSQGTYTISLGLVINSENIPGTNTDLRLFLVLDISQFGFDSWINDPTWLDSVLFTT